MKLAVFQILNNGCDGRSPTKVVYSSLREEDRDQQLKSFGTNQCYYSTNDCVLDLAVLGSQLINKLDGNDKMILDLCLQFDATSDPLTTAYHDVNITCYQPKKKTK